MANTTALVTHLSFGNKNGVLLKCTSDGTQAVGTGITTSFSAAWIAGTNDGGQTDNLVLNSDDGTEGTSVGELYFLKAPTNASVNYIIGLF